MELSNKTILLIVLAVIVVLAVGACIAVKNSMDLQSGERLNKNGSALDNSSDATAVTSTGYPSVSPLGEVIPTPIPDSQNNSQNILNNSTAIVSPIATASLAPSVNPGVNKFLSDNAFLGESGRITVQPYIFDNEGEASKADDYDFVFKPNNLPAINAKVLLLRFDSSPSGRTYQMVDIPNNPLTSPNCFAFGNPGFTFTGLQSGQYTVWVEYKGRVWPNEFMFADSKGQWRACGTTLDRGKVIPDNVASGTIYGYVVRNDLVPIDGVNITLYSCVAGNSSVPYVNIGMVSDTDNPQQSGYGGQGLFRFDGLPPGLYNVTAEKSGLSGHYIVNLKQDWNGMTADPTNGKYITLIL